MKKGLLSILAGALLVVGCQNYDDQFSSLESQINALASTVAGLSQVQSDLSSLAGTVSSLSSTVASLGSSIDTAVSNGLADITADIAALQAAVADVASSSDVTALQAAIAAAQSDLDDLLANSSVFTGKVDVNSVATLDAFHAMGSGLNIVNGSVAITVTSDMSQTKVQELVNNILTVTGDLSYTASANTIAETTFNNLTGVQTLTLKQGGGYQAKTLASAAKIVLNDTWKSTVTMIDFRALASVNTLTTGSTDHTVSFDKAAEIHLTSLPRYGAALTLVGKTGGVIDISALKDVDISGNQSALALTITGPASMSISNLDGKGGSITASKIGSLTVNDYDGKVVVGSDVTSFSSNNAVDLTGSTFADTETVVMKGVVDPNHTGSTADQGPAISFTSATDMTDVTLSGTFEGVTLTNQPKLDSVTISADVVGAINISTNADLSTVVLTGSKATGVTVSSNADLESLTIDTTMRGTAAKATTIDGAVTVKSNAALASLVVSSDKLRTVDVQDNDLLEKINFTGVTATGSTAKASVKIYDNNLMATVAQDKDNATGCTTCADGEKNDLGAYTTTSGMETLKKYLDAVIADTGSTAKVHFDVIDSITDKDGKESLASQTYESHPTTTRVLELAAAVGGADAKGAIAAQRAFIIDIDGGAATIGMKNAAGVSLFSNGTAATSAGSITINANKDLLISSLKAQANLDRFAAYGITMNAIRGGNSTGRVSLTQYGGVAANTTATLIGQRYTNTTANAAAVSTTNYGFGLDDLIKLEVGTNSVSVSPTGGSQTVTTLTAIGDAIVAAWAAKYGSSGTASASALATVTNAAGILTITMLDKGSSGYNQAVKVSVTPGTVTATNANNLDWVIGATRETTDDATIDADVIITLLSKDAGTSLNKVSGLTTNENAGTPYIELTSTKTVNTADATAAYAEAQEARADVVNAENGVDAVAPTTAAISFTRVHWLG